MDSPTNGDDDIVSSIRVRIRLVAKLVMIIYKVVVM